MNEETSVGIETTPPAMKTVDLTPVLVNESGKEVKLITTNEVEDKDGNPVMETNKSPLTLEKAVCDAVLRKRNEYFADNIAQYNIYKKVKDQKSVELSEEEIATIMDCVAAQREVFTVGQINDLITK